MAQEKLALRKHIKKKKPAYERQNAHKVKEVSRSSWRKPKGKHSKIRKQLGHRPPLVQVGYGSPSEVAGLLPNGLAPVLVSNVSDLDNLDAKKDAAVITSGVGMKKRLEIVKAAQDKKITLANVKDAANFAQSYLDERKKAQAQKDKKKTDRDKKAKAREEKSKKEADLDKKVAEKDEDAEKKEELKKQQEVLTKAQKE